MGFVVERLYGGGNPVMLDLVKNAGIGTSRNQNKPLRAEMENRSLITEDRWDYQKRS